MMKMCFAGLLFVLLSILNQNYSIERIVFSPIGFYRFLYYLGLIILFFICVLFSVSLIVSRRICLLPIANNFFTGNKLSD